MARRCDATIKRAVNANKLIGRKVGTGHNASYEVRKDSLIEWGKIGSYSTAEPVAASAPGTDAPTHSNGDLPPTAGADTETPLSVASKATKPKMNRRERTEKAKLPKEIRLVRRWKNNMRQASQDQTLAMIQWLSGRLTNTHGMRRKEAKAAVRNAKRGGHGQTTVAEAANKSLAE